MFDTRPQNEERKNGKKKTQLQRQEKMRHPKSRKKNKKHVDTNPQNEEDNGKEKKIQQHRQASERKKEMFVTRPQIKKN